MWSRPLRVMGSVVALLTIGCVWPALREGSRETRAASWVEAHRMVLPETLDGIGLFPRTYRQAIFDGLPAAAKADVWREYVVRVARSDEKLSVDQRRFLVRFAEALTAREFEPGAPYSDVTARLLADAPTILKTRPDILTRDAWMRDDLPAGRRGVGFGLAFRAFQIRASEFVAAQVEGYADTLPGCQCWVAAGGRWDCPGEDPLLKTCLPNPSGSPFCIVDNAPGHCDLFQNHPCDGMCATLSGGDGGGEPDNDGTCGGSPIVIHLERGVPQFSSASQGVVFDIYGTGPMLTAWPVNTATTGWLVLDRDGNGQIDSGLELFGNHTILSDGTAASDGYAALAELDANHDGWIDAADPGFGRLRVWLDRNRNGRTDANELVTLGSAGVERLSVDAHVSRKVDRWGNGFHLFAKVEPLPHVNIERLSWDIEPTVIPAP